MTNEVARSSPSAGALAALNTLKAGIQNVQQTIDVKGGDPFLRLIDDGSWVYGADNVEVEPGSLWAVNPLSLRHGWVAWESGKNADTSKGPKDEIMVLSTTPLPPKATLPDVATGLPAGVTCDWEQQYSFSMVCLSGEDKGEQVLYKTASVGGVRAIGDLVDKLGAQLDRDGDNIVPVIELLTGSYENKRYRKTVYYPVLEVRQWAPFTDKLPDLPLDGGVEAEAAPAPAPAPEPAKRQRKAVAETAAAPATPKTIDQMTEEELMEHIAAKKAAKAAAEAPVDPAAARRAALQAELDALNAPAQHTAQPATQAAPAAAAGAGQPMRRRRG